jgi:lincosamide nucleotidyltransferase A/C/D/E
VLKALTAGWRLVGDSPAARLLGLPVVSRWRLRLKEIRRPYDAMPAEDVIKVLEQLTRADVETWVVGGWGVDALLGRQSRPHNDLDLIMAADGAALWRARAALTALGYSRQLEEELPDKGPMSRHLVAANGIGQCVDLHPVNLSAAPFTPGAADGTLVPTPRVVGRLGGHPVPCVSAEVHLALKLCHERLSPLQAKDQEDIGLLQGLTGRGWEK